WFVPLADLSDPQLIPGAILMSLGEDSSSGQSALDQASELLERQPSLLILDNFEQLLSDPSLSNGAAETVRSLLARVPNLTILVTSRQVLGLEGEHEFPVPPLVTPATAAGAGPPGAASGSLVTAEMTAEGLSMYECVRLFIDRAQAVRPDF